jgi:hypothetical protein
MARGQPGMLALAGGAPAQPVMPGLSRPVVTDPRGRVTGSLQGTAGGSLPAQARPSSTSPHGPAVPQRLPAVPGHRRGSVDRDPAR